MPQSPEHGRAHPALLDWLRYFSAFMLYMYGVSKLAHLQFNLPSDIAGHPVGSLNGYQLTWYYFGYSRTYAILLGLTQVIGATLLLFRRSTLFAAVLMTPMIVNILLINMFILVNDYGPYVISSLIFVSMLTVLWHQRFGLASLFWDNQAAEPGSSRRVHLWIRICIVSAVAAIMVSGELMQHYLHR